MAVRILYADIPGWAKFYKEELETYPFMIAPLDVRRVMTNEKLEKFNARLYGHNVVFKSKKHYTWFILRWS